MATIKAVVRSQRADGFYQVYIRISHNSKTGYIKTDKIVHKKDVTKNGEFKDAYVMNYCAKRILDFTEKLNKVNCERWTVNEIIDYLTNIDEDICFSDYARRVHIAKLIDNDQERTAKNYKWALEHLERFVGTNRIMFSHLTAHVLGRWIESMGNTKRAKEMYPVCIRQIFKAAQREFNDYDNDIIRIKNNPWMKVDIPQADRTEKLAITPEECREFFAFPIPESRFAFPKAELARDVAMMVLCLGGINTVDLYNLKKKDCYNNIIRYNRAKTKKFRRDDAYMEMRVPPILYPLLEKYKDTTESEYMFNFYRRFCTSDSFGANVNAGLKELCNAMGIPKERQYCVYTFRHTWGTVAKNDIKVSMADVAFGMNHSSGHTVTRGYVKIDFAPAWELNEKVVDFIFFTNKPSRREEKEEEKQLRVAAKYMINGIAYHQGKKVAEINDIGFNNVEEVIARLAGELPEDIPYRSMVLFKITNMDKDQVAVYQRQKGNSFE